MNKIVNEEFCESLYKCQFLWFNYTKIWKNKEREEIITIMGGSECGIAG